LAHIAAGIELTAGNLGGLQDQFAAVLGGFNCLYFDKASVSVEDFERNVDLLADAAVAVPPVSDQRVGSARLVELVLSSARAGNSDTIDALAGLRECGTDMATLMALDMPRFSEFGAQIHRVLEYQMMLHPAVRDGIVESLPWHLVTHGRVIGKPLGGAGGGAAWLLLGARDESVRRILVAGGWTLRPVTISRSGLRPENVEQETGKC
jgi:galactokinase/mevalonate kinase-like predicted kinase